jgi:AcrR family transcriptional regulator
MNRMARRYEKKRRAERQKQTRQQIVEAAVTLHGKLGVAATTVTRIADLAGVGRQTVYRHFPDELSLGLACSGLYWERNPLPDFEPWRAVADPDERLRLGLLESYAYHRRTEAMISRAFADVRDSPLMQSYHDHWKAAADVLTSAWRLRGRSRTLLRAAIGHAIVFPTWHSLIREQGLTDRQAVDVMQRLSP